MVVAPKNTKRVGCRVKSYAKAGFNKMVIVNLDTIQMDASFVLYNGIKMKDFQKPKIYPCLQVQTLEGPPH